MSELHFYLSRPHGLTIPLVCTNRINTPEVAEDVLAAGHADMVSMARPFLADENFMAKAAEGRSVGQCWGDDASSGNVLFCGPACRE